MRLYYLRIIKVQTTSFINFLKSIYVFFQPLKKMQLNESTLCPKYVIRYFENYECGLKIQARTKGSANFRYLAEDCERILR